MYSSWDIMVRELGGGIWFFTSFWLVVAFGTYIARETIYTRRDRTLMFAASALVIYFVGSMIRGLLTWMQFFYAGNGWPVERWVATWPWFGLSVTLNIIGAELCIFLLSNWRWRITLSVVAVATSVLIPVAVRIWL
jgi:hypothetical protein